MKPRRSRGQSGLALFDLDFTLIPHDTIFLFANYSLKRRGGRLRFLFTIALQTLLYLLRRINLLQLKSAFLSHLQGMNAAEIDAMARRFAADEVRPRLYPQMLGELQRVQALGMTTVLNTASPEIYVQAIAAELGFDFYYGTAVVIESPAPRFFHLPGPNNKREAKLTAMARDFPAIAAAAQTPPETPPADIAYSDSSADLPMLRLARQAILINPSKSFAALGENSGWTIWRPATPYSGAIGKLWIFVRQSLGLYA